MRWYSSCEISAGLVSALVIGLLAMDGGVTLGSGIGDLLDEVIAGSDANVSMIEHGTARYSVVQTIFRPEKDAQTWTVVVHFDGSKTRIDSGWRRTIVDEERVVDFDAEFLGTPSQRQTHNYSAIIRVKSRAKPFLAHPRMLGFGDLLSAAEAVRQMRSQPKWRLKAEKDGEAIHVAAESEELGGKIEFWSSPDKGYAVTRYKKWALHSPERPYDEIESEFTRADNGSFVLARSTRICRVYESSSGLRDVTETHIELKTIALTKKPDSRLFTLEGLDVPQGARIQDRINGKEYLFGGGQRGEGNEEKR